MALPTSGPLSFSLIMAEKGLYNQTASISGLTAIYQDVDQNQPYSISEFYGADGIAAYHVYFTVNINSQGGGSAGGNIYAHDENGNTVYLNTQLVITLLVRGDFGSETTVESYMAEDGLSGWNCEFPNGELITEATIIGISPSSSGDQIYW